MNRHVVGNVTGPAISVEHLTFSYPGSGRAALTDLSVSVEHGEMVVLTGPSGSGKTTLLRAILADLHVPKGTCTILGVDPSELDSRTRPTFRRQIGCVFQDCKLLDDRNVLDNVMFALEVTGAAPSMIEERALLALEKTGMVEYAAKMPNQLSGGQMQRAGISRAIAVTPWILLADEPTGNLDAKNSAEIFALLQNINRAGTAVVIATHDPIIERNHHGRVLHLQDGRLTAHDGTDR